MVLILRPFRMVSGVCVRYCIFYSWPRDYLWWTCRPERSAPDDPWSVRWVGIVRRNDGKLPPHVCAATMGWHATRAPFAARGESALRKLRPKKGLGPQTLL